MAPSPSTSTVEPAIESVGCFCQVLPSHCCLRNVGICSACIEMKPMTNSEIQGAWMPETFVTKRDSSGRSSSRSQLPT